MIDLSLYDGKEVKNRIEKVGIELEGGWRTAPKGLQVIRDGSLDDWRHPPDVPTHLKGEVPSPPLNVSEVQNWLKNYYPTYSDHPRCAMHCHMSVKNDFLYQCLMDKAYWPVIVHETTKWAKNENFPNTHHIWERLAGRSPYCQFVFAADEQVKAKDKDWDRTRVGHRYTCINYTWGRYGTVECRLLPMMGDADQAYRAIKMLLDTTNKFLLATAKPEKAVKGEFPVDDLLEERSRVVII